MQKVELINLNRDALQRHRVFLFVAVVFLVVIACGTEQSQPATVTIVPLPTVLGSRPVSAPTERSAAFGTAVSALRTQEAIGDLKARHDVQSPDTEIPTPTSIPNLDIVSPIVDGQLVSELATMIGAGAARQFPSSLLPESEALPTDRVTELWTEFLADTFLVDITGTVTEFCKDGFGYQLGVVLNQVGTEVQIFESLRIPEREFDWQILPPEPGHMWFEPVITTGERSLSLSTPDGDLFPGLTVDVVEFGVFENLDCGDELPFEIPANVLELLIQNARVKQFPEALMAGGDSLTWEESIALWSEYIRDSLVVDARGFLMEWCADGTGAIVFEPDGARYNGAEFNWNVLSNRGHPTHQPRVKAQYFSGPSEDAVFINVSLEYPSDGIWRVGPTGAESLRFEHPNCGL